MTQSEFSTLRSRATQQVDHLGKLLASSRAALPQVRALADTVELLLAHSDRTQADERVALQLTVVRAEVEAAETMALASVSKSNQRGDHERARNMILAVKAWLKADSPALHPDLVQATDLSKSPPVSKVEDRKPALHAYLKKHDMLMKTFEINVKVHRTDISKWCKGRLPESSRKQRDLDKRLLPQS